MWPGLLVGSPSSEEHSPHRAGASMQPACPPSPVARRPRWTQRLLDWLLDEPWQRSTNGTAPRDPQPMPSGVTPLSVIRLEFIACLQDVETRRAGILSIRLRRTNSLRELWHLRTEVFNAVAQHNGQAEATARLARLNRHFPARAPRGAAGDAGH